MGILPSQFILRSEGYPQDAEYGQYCADAARQLAQTLRERQAQNNPMTIEEINDFLGTRIKGFFGSRREKARADKVHEQRQHSLTTPLNIKGENYRHYAREALLKHGDLGGVFSVNNGNARMLLDDRSDPVALTELTRSGPPQGASVAERHFWHMNNADHIGAVTLQHDIVPGSEKYVKAKAALDEALSEATGSGRLIHSASREEAALKTYYLYSHHMPFPRYSSTAGRILLEALAEVTGLETHHVAEGRDVNLEALTQHWSAFKQAHDAGVFWDKKVSPEEVLDWQRQKIAKPPVAAKIKNLQAYARDALYIAAMGENAECFTVPQATLKEVMLRGAVGDQRVTDAELLELGKKYGVDLKLEELRSLVENPIALEAGKVEYQTAQGEKKIANAVRFNCENFEAQDFMARSRGIGLGKILQENHMNLSPPVRESLQQPGMALTEDGEIVQGTFSAFTSTELETLRHAFELQNIPVTSRRETQGVSKAISSGAVAVEPQSLKTPENIAEKALSEPSKGVHGGKWATGIAIATAVAAGGGWVYHITHRDKNNSQVQGQDGPR